MQMRQAHMIRTCSNNAVVKYFPFQGPLLLVLSFFLSGLMVQFCQILRLNLRKKSQLEENELNNKFASTCTEFHFQCKIKTMRTSFSLKEKQPLLKVLVCNVTKTCEWKQDSKINEKPRTQRTASKCDSNIFWVSMTKNM